MTNKVLILRSTDDEIRVPLEKERIIIGRDKKCDIVLNDDSISRRHAAVLFRYGCVYIENISPTGQILLNQEPVEYVELTKSTELSIGAYQIMWVETDQASPSTRESRSEPPSGDVEYQPEGNVLPALSSPQPNMVDEPSVEENLQFQAPSADAVPNAENQSPDMAPNPEFDLALNADAPIESPNGAEHDEAEDDGEHELSIAPDEKTKAGGIEATAILKVLKGEHIGREIKLDYGYQWIVGRSPRSHVKIENQKLSRQHLKIVKIGSAYRVQDLGSQHGTRVNGVVVTDAPLHTFDTIQAGPVELQFLLVDPSAKEVARELAIEGPPLPIATDSFEEAEKTQFAPPVPYTPVSNQAPPPPPRYSQPSYASYGQAPQQPFSTSKGPESRGLVVWFKEQPKPRQFILGALVFLGVAMAALSLNESSDPAPQVVQTKVSDPSQVERLPESSVGKTNISAASDISPEFNNLSQADQDKVRDLYAQAEKEYVAKNWPAALSAATKITEYVKRYKRTTDIIAEAQANVNESQIGALAKNLGKIEDAAKENADKINLYCDEGDKALKEGRWDDAQSAFAKALNLDPNHKRATVGWAAASAKDATYVAKDLPELDPEFEEKQRERDEVDALRKRFREAKQNVINGSSSVAIAELKKLDEALRERMAGYQSESRAPAAIRSELLQESKALLSQVSEGLDAARSKLRADYQVQLSDADQFIANRQYAMARDIYDAIIEQEPGFDEARIARERLYVKMLTEAKSLYQEARVYESVGDIEQAVPGYTKTRELMTNVDNDEAAAYYQKADQRLKRLSRGPQ